MVSVQGIALRLQLTEENKDLESDTYLWLEVSSYFKPDLALRAFLLVASILRGFEERRSRTSWVGKRTHTL